MDKASEISFRIFVLALALWAGAGVFETIYSAAAWHADPVSWVRDAREPAGAINPWPAMTVVTALALIVAFALDPRGRRRGRAALVVMGAAFAVLVSTGLYFVPTLVALGQPAALTDAQIISMSRLWIALNLVRIAFLIVVLFVALAVVARPAAART